MSDNSKSKFTSRLTVHITRAMETGGADASQRDEPKRVVRAALRAYLDEQEDQSAAANTSRKFQRRVDYRTALSGWLWEADGQIHSNGQRKSMAELLEDAIGAGMTESSFTAG
jgi:hypothetical protein